MSLTLAIATRGDAAALECIVRSVCASFGFGCSFGLDTAHERVRHGLAAVAQFRALDSFAFIHAPDGPVAEAALLGGQLVAGRDKPRALAFMSELCNRLHASVGYLVIMFAVEEWPATQFVRLKKGSCSDFRELLEQPCAWCEELWLPNTGDATCNDDFPLLFEISP